MKRLILIVLRFFFELPILIFQLKHIKKHKDTIPFDERIDWTRRLLKKATKRARVNLTITGTEYLHAGRFDCLHPKCRAANCKTVQTANGSERA